MGWIDSGAAYTVADGVPVIVTKPRAPFSIAVHPGAGWVRL